MGLRGRWVINSVQTLVDRQLLVVSDGYGLSYSIGDHYIRWTITSLKRGTRELKHYLAEAATETRFMLERAAAVREKADGGKTRL